MSNTEQKIDVSQKVLSALDHERVVPRPKWYFRAFNGGVWALGIGATLCGAVAVSATLFVLVATPVRLYLATHDNNAEFWLDFLPVLWICLFVAFVFAADFFLKRTRRGYRYSLVVITLSSATLSLLLGYLGFLIGLGEFLERRVGPAIPFHTPPHLLSERLLYQPEKGIITGTVSDEGSILIRGRDGELWNLDLDYLSPMQRAYFEPGMVVSVIGTSTSDRLFIVCMVLKSSDRLRGASEQDASDDADENERNLAEERNTVCKGVRPYQRLQANTQ